MLLVFGGDVWWVVVVGGFWIGCIVYVDWVIVCDWDGDGVIGCGWCVFVVGRGNDGDVVGVGFFVVGYFFDNDIVCGVCVDYGCGY